eukprot:3025243-Pyramimonas_sp.AAC.1
MCQLAADWINATVNQALKVKDGSISVALWARRGTRTCGSELGGIANHYLADAMGLQRSAGENMQYKLNAVLHGDCKGRAILA